MITEDDLRIVRSRKDIELLQAVAAGDVAFYFDTDGTGVDFMAGTGIPRLVTAPMRYLRKHGFAHLNRRKPGTARRQIWELTEKGRAVLDHWESRAQP